MHNHGLGSWMGKRRLKSPHKTALVWDEGKTITYAQLADLVDDVASTLASCGIGKGARVAYLGENSPAFMATLLGAVQLGGVFVPVNTRLAAPEIEYILTNSGARVLIHDAEFTERLSGVIDAVPHVITTNPEGLDVPVSARGAGRPDTSVTLDDPAVILYTSGTTGKPKGAILTHGNLTWASLNAIVDYDIVSTDVALMISPLFHVASLGMGALPIIMKGGTLILEKRFEPGHALALIQRYGVSMLAGVPTTYQMLCDHPDWATTDVSTMRKLTCGGSAVPARILNAYEERGLSFSQGYGMTETSPGVSSLAAERTRDKQGSVGVPHFFTDVRIVDEDGHQVPPGTVGEIEIRGPNVFAGYHGLPAETAAAFAEGDWFRSGDLGRFDDDGFLHISDRLKDMIISGGENIYPAEIENLINDIDGVTGAAVIGVPHERWGEVPWAVVTVRDDTTLDRESVRSHLDGRLARYKLPANVVVVEELPRTASGKIRKADLRTRFAGSNG
ncbi:acyl-CoA synthetase [Salinibacterium hongtaonis]|uniref:acyl-CoA synthetase n=1 Tax=Homoserinimonas hongtaonis TaxID=2079791 RepID=UPI000D338CB8|nr:long-chain fatty acid--CoA ligase [Salinibacterium hongtaonis]AWB90226.1 p-hydroxycinnamoyl-CoA synthetase [Salinibacterium hongtaonis]